MRIPKLILLILAFAIKVTFEAADEKVSDLSNGLAVTFRSLDGDQADHTVRPNFMLYVPEGETPSPFIDSGMFTAEWEGAINLDLRDRFIFQAELNGKLKLEINGKLVFEAIGDGSSMTEPTKRIRLNSKVNTIKAFYASPDKGDAFFRLYWATPDYLNEPIPSKFLKHIQNENTKKGALLRYGRQLVADHRCFKCHLMDAPKVGMPELEMDAPAFVGIGSRRGVEWMASWILDPKKMRSSAKMPVMLHGNNAENDANAIATYIASLNGTKLNELSDSSDVKPIIGLDVTEGQNLYQQMNCAACHTVAAGPDVEGKLSLYQTARKFSQPAWLSEFLQNPQEHYKWIRMPNFSFDKKESNALASYLFSVSDLNKKTQPKADEILISKGKKLVSTKGCLNCHQDSLINLDNSFLAKAISDLDKGCLDKTSNEQSIRFNFSSKERFAINYFLKKGRSSLGQSNWSEFALRQTTDLNCENCHGQMENVPSFDILGGKLKPEWTHSLLSGRLTSKPRPWLQAKMPSFSMRAEGLAKGLAMLNGHSPSTLEQPPIDVNKAGIGRKLVSSNGGFFCFSCHAIGNLKPAQVFDAQGINLAHVGDRLLPEYFRRWMRNPLRVDPQTKMPAYFNKGQSALFEILDGDADRQIDALYHYIRQGDLMLPPDTPGQ